MLYTKYATPLMIRVAKSTVIDLNLDLIAWCSVIRNSMMKFRDDLPL